MHSNRVFLFFFCAEPTWTDNENMTQIQNKSAVGDKCNIQQTESNEKVAEGCMQNSGKEDQWQ